MKSPQESVITLLGNNSGRNLGDATILASILSEFKKTIPNGKFYVPSVIPSFISKHYSQKYNVKGVNVLPWTGSIRLLGLPTIWCMAKSKIAMICDGIIFGRHLFSPHNFLITLFFLVPWAKLVGCKLVCFCCGIGPFPNRLSKIMARYLINSCDLIIMRDADSIALAKEIGVTKEMHLAGDIALTNEVSSRERGIEILKEKGLDPSLPILGLNITPYFDSWLKKEERMENKEAFVRHFVEGVSAAQAKLEQEHGYSKVQKGFISCSPMDQGLCEEVAERCGAVVINNVDYLSHDIQAVMRECSLILAMRFHCLILSTGVGVPVASLMYAPKVKSYMSLLHSVPYGLELSKATSNEIENLIVVAWRNRESLRIEQQRAIEELRMTAHGAVKMVTERYFSEVADDLFVTSSKAI